MKFLPNIHIFVIGKYNWVISKRFSNMNVFTIKFCRKLKWKDNQGERGNHIKFLTINEELVQTVFKLVILVPFPFYLNSSEFT